MTDKTDIAALRVKHQTLMNFLAARLTECNRINYCWDEVTALSAFTSLLLDQFEEKLQQASETNSSNLNIKLALHERVVKAEKEVITLKGELLPVGEIVAWSGTDIEKGITREIDFRFLRFDVQPGQQLFTAPQKPVVLLNKITQADAPEVAEISAQVERLGLKGAYGAYAAGWNAAIVAAGCIVSDK